MIINQRKQNGKKKKLSNAITMQHDDGVILQRMFKNGESYLKKNEEKEKKNKKEAFWRKFVQWITKHPVDNKSKNIS